MPRATRSKKAAVTPVVHEDVLAPADVPLPPSPQQIAAERPPLGELETLNLDEAVLPPAVEDVAIALEALKKPKGKSRKARGGRKAKKVLNKKDGLRPEKPVNEAAAVKKACDELMKRREDGKENATSDSIGTTR